MAKMACTATAEPREPTTPIVLAVTACRCTGVAAMTRFGMAALIRPPPKA